MSCPLPNSMLQPRGAVNQTQRRSIKYDIDDVKHERCQKSAESAHIIAFIAERCDAQSETRGRHAAMEAYAGSTQATADPTVGAGRPGRDPVGLRGTERKRVTRGLPCGERHGMGRMGERRKSARGSHD